MSEPVTVPEPSAEEMDRAVEAVWIVIMGVVPRDVLAFALRAALPHLSAGVVAAAVKAEQDRTRQQIGALTSIEVAEMPGEWLHRYDVERIVFARGETP